MTLTDTNWQLSAACAGDLAWFSHHSDDNKQTCAECPVRMTCLEFALTSEGGMAAAHRFGVYGGLTPEERAKLNHTQQRRARRLIARAYRDLPPIDHGTVNGYLAHIRRKEKACDSCREAKKLAQRERRAGMQVSA